MLISEFAERYKVRIRRDSCGAEIIAGKRFAKDKLIPESRLEYRSHIFDNGDGRFGVCLIFDSLRVWNARRRQLASAGFTIRQDGQAEGVALFDPTDKTLAKLALKIAGARERRVPSPAQLSNLQKARDTRFKAA